MGHGCGTCNVSRKSVGAASPSLAAAGARCFQAYCGGYSGGDGGAVANRRVAPAPSIEEVTDSGSRRRRADVGPAAVGLDPRTATGAAHDAREVGWLRDTLQPPTSPAAVDDAVPIRCGGDAASLGVAVGHGCAA